MAKVLSMHIGERIIRLAEVQVSGKLTNITKIHTFDIPDEATKDGKVRLSDEVVTAIRAGLAESEILSKEVLASSKPMTMIIAATARPDRYSYRACP